MEDVRREVEEIGQVKRMQVHERDNGEEIIIDKSQEEKQVLARVASHCLLIASYFSFTSLSPSWLSVKEKKRKKGKKKKSLKRERETERKQ